MGVERCAVSNGRQPALARHLGASDFPRPHSFADGRNELPGNQYTISRGDINFANPFRLDPVLNIEATTTIRQYEVTLDFTAPPAASPSRTAPIAIAFERHHRAAGAGTNGRRKRATLRDRAEQPDWALPRCSRRPFRASSAGASSACLASAISASARRSQGSPRSSRTPSQALRSSSRFRAASSLLTSRISPRRSTRSSRSNTQSTVNSPSSACATKMARSASTSSARRVQVAHEEPMAPRLWRYNLTYAGRGRRCG